MISRHLRNLCGIKRPHNDGLRYYFAYLEIVRDKTLHQCLIRPLPSPAQLETLLDIREHLSPRAQALIHEIASCQRVQVSVLDDGCAVDLEVDTWRNTPTPIHTAATTT